MRQESENIRHELPLLSFQVRHREQKPEMKGLISWSIQRMAELNGGSRLTSPGIEEESLDDQALKEYANKLEYLGIIIERAKRIMPAVQRIKADLQVLYRAINIVRAQDGSSYIPVPERENSFNLDLSILFEHLSITESNQLKRAQTWLQSLKQHEFYVSSLTSDQWQTLNDADLATDELRRYSIEDEAMIIMIVDQLFTTGEIEPYQEKWLEATLTFHENHPYPSSLE